MADLLHRLCDLVADHLLAVGQDGANPGNLLRGLDLLLDQLRDQHVAGILITPVGRSPGYVQRLTHRDLPPLVTTDQACPAAARFRRRRRPPNSPARPPGCTSTVRLTTATTAAPITAAPRR